MLRAEVFPKNFTKELDRLAADHFAQMIDSLVAGEVGVHLGVHLHTIHGVDVQPLFHIRVDESVCTLIGYHSGHLFREGCLVEKCTGIGQCP